MPDSHNIDPLLIVKDRINDAVIPHADAPQILFTNQFAGTRGRGCMANASILVMTLLISSPPSASNSLRAERASVTVYSATQFAMPA